jgi:Acetyltransferase (GNAT) domain
VTAPLRVRPLDAAESEPWDRLVRESPHGSAYATRAYLEALGEATGGTHRILVAERGGELQGGVALHEERSRFGPFVSDRRLLYYDGPVLRAPAARYASERTAQEVEVLGALAEAIEQQGYASVRMKCRGPLRDARAFQSRGWTVEVAYTYVVDVRDVAAAWARAERNLRRLVERCAHAGTTLDEDGDFATFFRFHSETSRRKGAPLYLPEAAFRRWFERVREAGLAALFHARLPSGQPIASQIVLLGHPVTHTVAAAADPEHQRLGANAFLRWKVMEELSRRGHVANDLTDAALNPVTHFKSQLGGELTPCLVVSTPPTLRYRLGRRASELATALASRLRGGGNGHGHGNGSPAS